jgi:hypothetical protein
VVPERQEINEVSLRTDLACWPVSSISCRQWGGVQEKPTMFFELNIQYWKSQEVEAAGIWRDEFQKGESVTK